MNRSGNQIIGDSTLGLPYDFRSSVDDDLGVNNHRGAESYNKENLEYTELAEKFRSTDN